jgi:hypothetical protein
LAVAKANNLELEFVHTEPAKGVSADYKKLNRLGKVPTFEGADGYVLFEAIAIAIYSKSHAFNMYAKSGELEAPATAMMNIIYNQFSSYPCLKTTVDIVFTL